MEQQKELKPSSQLGEGKFREFLYVLEVLFPEQDISNTESKYYKKAKYVFEHFKNNWTEKEFDYVMEKFFKSWNYHNWQPANLLEIHSKQFGNNEMVM